MIELLDAGQAVHDIPIHKELQELTKQGANLWFQYHFDYAWIIKKIGDVKGKKILDAGSAKGALQFYLAKYGADVYSCDLNDYTDEIKKINPDIKFQVCNFGDERRFFKYPDNFFDIIVCTSVVEHVLPVSIKRAIKNFQDVLKPNGLLILTTNAGECFAITENYVQFGLNDLNKYFLCDGLSYLNNENNFKDYKLLYGRMCEIFINNNIKPLPFIPLGIVLIKNGTKI